MLVFYVFPNRIIIFHSSTLESIWSDTEVLRIMTKIILGKWVPEISRSHKWAPEKEKWVPEIISAVKITRKISWKSGPPVLKICTISKGARSKVGGGVVRSQHGKQIVVPFSRSDRASQHYIPQTILTLGTTDVRCNQSVGWLIWRACTSVMSCVGSNLHLTLRRLISRSSSRN